MKLEAILKLVTLPEGVEIDFGPLVEEWNRQYNGAVKAVTEDVTTKATDKATSELLSKYGLKSLEDIKTLQDNALSAEEKGSKEFNDLKREFEDMTANLKVKDAELVKQNQLSILGKMNINPDKLSSAYKLISSEVTDENDFETASKKFIEDTPEWLGKTGPSVNLGVEGIVKTLPGDAKIDDQW